MFSLYNTSEISTLLLLVIYLFVFLSLSAAVSAGCGGNQYGIIRCVARTKVIDFKYLYRYINKEKVSSVYTSNAVTRK